MSKLIKKGLEAATASRKASRFLQLQTDTDHDVAALGELAETLTVDLHSHWDLNPAPHLVCLGIGCPSCAMGHEPTSTSYFPVLTKEGDVKFLILKPSILNQLKDYVSAVGDLTGRTIRLRKTGSGMKTRYKAVPLGKKVKVSGFTIPDLEPHLGPLTLEDQLTRLEEAGVKVGPIRSKVEKELASLDTDETPIDVFEEVEETEEEDDSWGSV